MFIFWMFVSMMLPIAFMAVVICIALLLIGNAEISVAALDRAKRRNPISPYERYEPAPMHDARGNRSWESALESEAQRIRRRSLGGYH